MHFTIADFMLDIIQNSVEAESSEIRIDLTETESSMRFAIRDNGVGMAPEELRKAKDPFFTNGVKHKKRKVGLGLPFLIQTIEMTDGDFDISSEKGKGTMVIADFQLDHMDTPPTGDIIALIYQAMCFEGTFEMVIRRSAEFVDEEYVIRRSELLEALGDLHTAGNMNLLRHFIQSQEDEIVQKKEQIYG
ncbi:MAG: ATP-binding protein [Spirochaetia bacterium]